MQQNHAREHWTARLDEQRLSSAGTVILLLACAIAAVALPLYAGSPGTQAEQHGIQPTPRIQAQAGVHVPPDLGVR